MARVARLTLGYYTVCTAAAVALGILLVTVIEPGQGSPLSGGSVTSCHTPDLKVLTSPDLPPRSANVCHLTPGSQSSATASKAQACKSPPLR